MTDIVERLNDEADLCRNDGADDVSKLLDEAATRIAALEERVRVLEGALRDIVWSDEYSIKSDMIGNGCEHGFKPASSCPNESCEKGSLERLIARALGEQP